MRKRLLSFALLCFVAASVYSAVDKDDIYVLKESFESGVIPEGWTQEYVNSSVYGEHPWVVESASSAQNPLGAADGDYRIVLRNNSSATIGYTTRLISPVLDLTMGKVFQPILVFSHAQQQRTGDFDQLKVYYRTSADSRWVRFDDDKFNHKIAKWQTDTLQLTAQSATYQIMFEVTDNFGYGVVLDDIKVRPMPTCEVPHDFSLNSITTNSAIIGWLASFDTDSFEVALSEIEITSMDDADEKDILYHGFVGDDNFSFSTSEVGLELKQDTKYYLYVRSYCYASISDWGVTSFRTKNIVNLPLNATFTEGNGWEYRQGIVLHINHWSFGTSMVKDDGVSMAFMPFVNTATSESSRKNYAYDGSFALVFSGNTNTSTYIPAGQWEYAATPELNVESLKDVVVSFWGTSYDNFKENSAHGIIVGVMTNPADFSTFVAVDTCYINETKSFNKFAVSLKDYSGEGKYVAFASNFGDKDNIFFVDNISMVLILLLTQVEMPIMWLLPSTCLMLVAKCFLNRAPTWKKLC